MELEPIEDMDDNIYSQDLKKFIKVSLEGMTKQLLQGFEVMATQLRGKMEAASSRSSHHGKKNNIIRF